MSQKLLIAAALTLGLGTASAMAQTTPAHPETGAASSGAQHMLPMGWEGPIGDAFFSDAQTGKLRSDAEIRANWKGLTTEQQARVHSDCANIDTAATKTDNDKMTTGSVKPGDASVTASVKQVCGMVAAK